MGLGSQILKKPIPVSVYRDQKGTGSRIRNTAEGEAYRAAVQDSRGPRPAPTRNSSCSHRRRTCTDAAYHSHNWTNKNITVNRGIFGADPISPCSGSGCGIISMF